MANHHAAPDNVLTREEQRAARKRILQDAYDRLLIGPFQAFAAGCATVFGIAVLEGFVYLRPIAHCPPEISIWDRLVFLGRYGRAQILPSLIWGQQQPLTLAAAYDMSPKMFWKDLTPRRILMVNRLLSLRGAVAGTILISQVISIANVSQQAKEAYSQRIETGREPPLSDDNIARKEDEGVVIRLAGKFSDTTSLGMAKSGRRHLFPIFEDSKIPEVQQILHRHGVKQGNQHSIPLFWQVEDGRYGSPESWAGMTIPRHWLFDISNTTTTTRATKPPREAQKLLILEADTTHGEAGSLSLEAPGLASDLDLDLYEMSQGFHQLQQLVKGNSHQTVRIVLTESEGIIKSGGGRVMTVREYIDSLNLADIVVDARVPLLIMFRKWLEERDQQQQSTHYAKPTMIGWSSPLAFLRRANQHKPVILETPNSSWFQSIRAALKPMGYDVLDISEALDLYGSSIHSIPMFVYEKTTQDTIHKISRLLEQNIVRQENVCALCPTHDQDGLIESNLQDSNAGNNTHEIAIICSSDLYDTLLRQVRYQLVSGKSVGEIQQVLDENIETFLSTADPSLGSDLNLRRLNVRL